MRKLCVLFLFIISPFAFSSEDSNNINLHEILFNNASATPLDMLYLPVEALPYRHYICELCEVPACGCTD